MLHMLHEQLMQMLAACSFKYLFGLGRLSVEPRAIVVGGVGGVSDVIINEPLLVNDGVGEGGLFLAGRVPIEIH